MTDDKARRSIISQLCAEIEVYVAFSVVNVPPEMLSDLSLAQTDLIVEIIKRPAKSTKKAKRACFLHDSQRLLAQLFRVGLKRLNRFLNVWDVNVPVSSNLSPLLIQTP